MSMERLAELALTITGKKVTLGGSYGWWQDEGKIFVPAEDEEGLVHEILHWVVASDAERTWPNLALDEDAFEINQQLPVGERLRGFTRTTPSRRERQVCILERIVFRQRGFKLRGSCFRLEQPTSWDRRHVAKRLAALAHKHGDILKKIADAMTTGKSCFDFQIGAR